MSISVIINTFNEEKNIKNALDSVQSWADEIIVVDMFSDDQTATIAEEYGAKVFYHERVGYSEPARAFAVEKASHDWILILDADEMIPKPLSEKLFKIIRENQYDIVMIPRQNYLLGTNISHTGWGPEQDYQMRFFKKGKIEFKSTIHKYMTPDPNSKITRLSFEDKIAIIHFNYLNINHFVDKMNRYTSVEAKQLLLAKTPRMPSSKVIFLLIKEFIYRFFIKRGFKDGWRGFYLSGMMVFYRLLMYGKHREIYEGLDEQSIHTKYEMIAKKILQEYQ